MDNPIQGNPTVLDKLYNADRQKYESKGITLDQFYVDMRDPVIQQKVYVSRDLQNKGIDFRQFQHDLGVDPIVQPGSIKDLFRVAEENPKDGYSSYNPNSKSGAWGRYQFIWGTHKAPIKNLTNIDNTDDFLKSKYAQEEYMDHVINNEYTSHLPTLRELAKNNDKYKNYNDNELMYLEHHEGLKGAKHLLTTGESLFGSIPAIDTAITKMRNYQGKLDRSVAADVQVADNKQKKEIKGDLMAVGEQLDKEATSKVNASLDLKYNKLSFGDKVADAYKRGGFFKVLTDALPFTDADATPTEVKAAKLDIIAKTPKYQGLVKSEDDLAQLTNGYGYKRDAEVEKIATKINDDIKSDINNDAGIFDYFSGEKYYKKNGKEYVNVSLGKFGDIFVEGIDRSKTEVELSKLMSLKEHPAITPKMSVQDKQELNNALLRAQSDYSKADIFRKDHFGTKTQDFLEYNSKVYNNKLNELTAIHGSKENIDPNDPGVKELQDIEANFNKSLDNFKSQDVKYKMASEFEATKQNIINNYDKDIKAMTGWQRFLHKSDRLLNELPEYTNDSFLGLGKVIGTGIDAGLNTDIATTSLIEDAYAAKTIRSTAETNAGLIETAYLGNDVYAKYQDGKHIGFVDSDFYDISLPEAENKRLSSLAEKVTPADISTSINWSAINEGVRGGIMDYAPLLIGGTGITTVMKGLGAKTARNKALSKVGQSMINLADNKYFTTLASTFGGFAGKITKGAIEEGGLINADEIFIAGVSKTATEAIIEAINPIEGKILTGKIFDTGAINVKAFAKMVSDKGFVPSLKDISKVLSSNLLQQGISEGAEEFIASLSEPLVLNNILNNVIDTNFSTDVNLRDVAEATLIGSLSGLALGAGTNIRYGKNLKSSIVQDAIRSSLQNEKFFNTTLDNLRDQQLADIEKSNSETKDQDAAKVTENYNHTKKVYDQAKNDAAFVFKESVKGYVPSERYQRYVSDIAFNKAILDNIEAPTDIESEDIKSQSEKLGADLKDLQVYYANGFNGYATVNSINNSLGADAKLTNKEYQDNKDKLTESFREIVAKVAKNKWSEEVKERQIKVDMGVKISTIKNGKATETAQKQADDLKEEMKQAEEKVAKEEAKAKVNESFNKGENPTSNGVPDDLVEQVLKEEKATVTQRLAGIKPNDINGKLSYNKENFQVLIDDHPSQAVFIQAEQARLEKELSDSQNANYRDQVVKAAGTPVTTDTFAERYEGKPELEENDNKQIDDAYVDHVATIKEELNEEFNPEELKEALNDKPLLEKISNPEEFPDYAEVAAETIPGNNIPDITAPTVTPEFIIDDSPVPTDEELTSSTDKVADIEKRRQEELNNPKEGLTKKDALIEAQKDLGNLDTKEKRDRNKDRIEALKQFINLLSNSNSIEEAHDKFKDSFTETTPVTNRIAELFNAIFGAKNNINAKYDAELAVLNNTTQSEVTKEDLDFLGPLPTSTPVPELKVTVLQAPIITTISNTNPVMANENVVVDGPMYIQYLNGSAHIRIKLADNSYRILPFADVKNTKSVLTKYGTEYFTIVPVNDYEFIIKTDANGTVHKYDEQFIIDNISIGDTVYYEYDPNSKYNSGSNTSDEVTVAVYVKDGKLVTPETEGATTKYIGRISSGKTQATSKANVLSHIKNTEGKKQIPVLVDNLTMFTNNQFGKKRDITIAELLEHKENLKVIGVEFTDPTIINNGLIRNARFLTPSNDTNNGIEKIPSNVKVHPHYLGSLAIYIKGQLLKLDTKVLKDTPVLFNKLKAQLDQFEKAKGLKEVISVVQILRGNGDEIVFKNVRDPKSEFKNEEAENPRGGIESIYYHFNRKGDDKYTMVKKPTDNDFMTKDQLLGMLGDYRVHIDHNLIDNDFYLEDVVQHAVQAEVPLNQPFFNNPRLYLANNIQANPEVKKDIVITEEQKSKPDVPSTPAADTPKKVFKKTKFKIGSKTNSPELTKGGDWIRERFSEIGVEISDELLENLINGIQLAPGEKVWGAFHRASVILASDANVKVERHEAYHVLFNLFLNDKQRDQIRAEVRSKFGKDLTDLQAEEKLAELFEDYKDRLLFDNDWSKANPKIANFFNKIYKWLYKNFNILQSYLTDSVTIDKLFYQLENNIIGRDFLGNRKQSVQNLFKRNLDNILNEPKFSISNWTSAQTHRYATFVNKDLFSMYLETEYDSNNLNEIVDNNTTVDSILAGYVKNFDAVVQAYIEQTPTADQSVIHDIAKQFKSNKDFQFIVKKNLKITQNIVIDAEYEDTVDDYLEDNEDVNENTNDSESQRESWQGGAALVDSKSRASSRLRGLFSNYIYKKEIDDNGKKGLEPFTYDDTNQFKFYGANEIHNLLLEKLSNSTSKKDMVERLNSLLDNYTWMIDLLRDIRGIDGETALELYNDGKLKIDYDLELQNIDSVAGGWILKSMWYAIGDQKNNDPVQLLYSKGSARLDNLRADNKGKSIKNSMLYNIDVLSSSESKLKSLGKELTDLYNKVIQPAYKNDPQDYLDFIKLLGYEVDIDQARELSSVNKTASVSGNRLTNRAYILDRFKAITNSFKSYNADNNLSSLQSDLTLDFTGLANHISDYTLNPGNLSFKNVIGELEFAHIPNNYITRQFDLMKADPKKWVAGKISSVRGALTYPVVLQARLPFYKDLLSNYQTYFGIAIDGFFNTENQNSGKQYKDYTEQDILVNDINRYIAGPGPNKKGGVYNFGVFSDAPVRYVYYGNKFTKEQIVDKLTAIVHGEFERIQLVRQLNNVTSYKNIANTGLIIHTIPSLNKLLPFIPETWSGLNDSQIYDPNVSTKSVTDVIKNHIDNYLSTEAYGTYIDKFKEYGQITEDSNIHDIKLADKSKLLKDSKNLLFEYFINQFYVNATMQIVFAGDPAFYKPNDFHKSGVKSYQDVLKPEFNPYYLQTGIDSVKRFKQLVSPMITGWFNDPTFKVIILKDIYDKVSSEIPAALKAAKYEEKVESVLSKEYGITADGKINSKKANLSDAGAYHTLGRRVAIMKAYQSWKPKYQAIIDRLEQGKGTKSDLEFVMQPLKPFLFTNQHRMESTGTEANPMVMQVPIQLKLSETVLIPQVAYITNDGKVLNPSRNDFDNNFSNYKYKDLAKILYLMQNSNADMVVFESGSKAASFNILDLNNFSGEYVQRAKDDFKSNLIGDDLDDSLIEDTIYENLMTSISTDNTLELSNDDYGDQMSVPEKTLDAKVGEGTQERKIMTAGIDPNHKFTFMGRTYNGYEVNELLDKISIDSVKESLDKVVEKIGTYAKFTNYLRNQLVDKNASVDVLDALQVQEDGLTRVPLETLGKKAEHVANSLFKKTSKNKKFGASLVNQPGVGFSEELKLVFKELPDGTKVVDYYEAAIPAYSKHLLKYADKDGVINPADLPDKLLRAFFYRIPTEDKYSMFPIKIVKFLPQSQGGTIILPAEATVIAGLDFDIDKLYGYFYNFTATYDGNFIDSLTKKLNNDFGATFTPNEVSKLVDDVTDSNMELLSESFEDPQAVISIINSEISKSLSRPSLKVIESSFDSKEGRDNLRLDIYNSLVNTPAYTKAMLRIGNKARLIKLRDTLSTEATSGYKSFADPSVQAENSAKNIIGKRLIGIFANANAFINLIQGNTELLLSNPLTFNENTYTSIGANIENITKNISELLFASTEDVKDPVLGPLNINESTANVLITMLALNIPFEESIQFLNSPVMKYISKMHQTQPSRRLNAIYAGSPFNVDPNIQQILATAEEFSKVISAAKIDTGNVGPDLNVVNNKIKSINSAIKRSRSEYGIFNNVNEILPNIYYNSSKKEYEVSGETVKVKQLIAYTQVLATEMNILKNYFSYLTGDFYNYTSLFEVLTKSSNLRDDQLKTIIYATYDYFIQHMLLEKVPNFGKIVTNLPEYFSKHEFSPETAPLKNVLEVDINKNNNTKQILMKVDNFTSAQIEYYKGLFEILIKEDIDSTDPGHINFGTNLAIYSLLLGTSFSYRGFSKLLPNIFWNTAIGKDIRNIINGKSSLNFDSSDLFTGVIYNNFTKLVPKIDSNDVQVTGATYKILKDSDKNNKGNHLPYIFFNTKVGKIYTNTLLQHVGDGVYTEVLKSSGKSYIKDYTFSMPTVNNNDDVFTEFEEFIVSDNFDALPAPIDNGEFSYGTDEEYNDFIKDEPPTRDELDDSPPIKPC